MPVNVNRIISGLVEIPLSIEYKSRVAWQMYSPFYYPSNNVTNYRWRQPSQIQTVRLADKIE